MAYRKTLMFASVCLMLSASFMLARADESETTVTSAVTSTESLKSTSISSDASSTLSATSDPLSGPPDSLGNNTDSGNFLDTLVNIVSGFLASNNNNRDNNSNSGNNSNNNQTMQQPSQILQGILGGLSNPLISGMLKGILQQAGIDDAYIPVILKVSEVVQKIFSGQTDALVTDLHTALVDVGISGPCSEDIIIVLAGVISGEDFATSVLDATGKPESGVKTGRLKFLGDFYECTSINSPVYNNFSKQLETFKGKYCTVSASVGVRDILGLEQALELGLCVSDRCSARDIKILFEEIEKVVTDGNVALPLDVTCNEDLEYGTDFIVCSIIVGVFVFLVIIGTIYDVIYVQLAENKVKPTHRSHSNGHNVQATTAHPPVYSEKAETNNGFINNEGDINGKITSETKLDAIHVDVPKESVDRTADRVVPAKPERSMLRSVLLAFSAYSNGVKILSTSQGSGSLGALNGVRFLSMGWVILGHTIYFSVQHDANLAIYGFGKLQDFSFNAILYAMVSVDSFFAISGILVGYLTLRELKKVDGAKNLNWFMFYFHRFWRLTPIYMLVIMIGTVLMPYMIHGPMRKNEDNLFMADCRSLWWTNLLYANNYVHPDGRMCMAWTWYLANDMQFYIVSPLILLPLFYNIYAGIGSSLLFLTLTSVATGVVANDHHYPAQIYSQVAPQPLDEDYMQNLYFPSYSRMGPYIVGLFTGYLLYKTKCKVGIHKYVNVLLWIACLGLSMSVVYSMYEDNGEHVLSVKESAAYLALHRTAWGVVVCWVVFSCAVGSGGWINQLLSWKGLTPLARLTYSAYLIHPLVMIVFYSSRPAATYFTTYELIYLFLGHMCMSYGIGFIVSLLFESPMMGLEKALFKQGKK